MNNTIDTCPMDGTQYSQFCALLPSHQENHTYHLCEYRDECCQLYESLKHVSHTCYTIEQVAIL